MSRSEALRPTIINVTLTSADQEYEAQLPVGTKHFSMQARGTEAVRFAFESGKVGPSSAPYATVKGNGSYTAPEKMGWSWTVESQTNGPIIYLASGTAGAIVEIVVWRDIYDRVV